MSEMNTIKVLDKGFVSLLNVSGPVRRPNNQFDASSVDPAISARISFGNFNTDSNNGRTREQDLKLVKYLIENKHCFFETMQVLTSTGWHYWKDLPPMTEFLVPDPSTKALKKEILPVMSWDIDEDLYCFRSKKMEYKVTKYHDLYIKGKYDSNFTKQKAITATNWGNHECGSTYSLYPKEGDYCAKLAFVGFFLGDGCFAATNTISFHLQKQRKKDFLQATCDRLGIYYKSSITATGEVFWITPPDWLSYFIDMFTSTSNKSFKVSVATLSELEVRGLWLGLVNSDGHTNIKKGRVEFSSTSQKLITLFETCSSLLGYEAHQLQTFKGVHSIHATILPENLGRRAKYVYKERNKGKVYCTTTSTGLLIVRGSPNSHSYVCGNSTPIEMIEIWLEMKLPIFVARQFVRHRTATINEISGRYVQLPEDWYIPEVVGAKSADKKQGQDNSLDEAAQDWFKHALNKQCYDSYLLYKMALSNNVAPEHARLLLHVNHYTHWVLKQDLHNMIHFLKLRLHEHAQVEAREYARAILELLRGAIPDILEIAFPDE